MTYDLRDDYDPNSCCDIEFDSLAHAVEVARLIRNTDYLQITDTYNNWHIFSYDECYEKYSDSYMGMLGVELYKSVNGVETFYTAPDAPDYEDIMRLSNGAKIESLR